MNLQYKKLQMIVSAQDFTTLLKNFIEFKKELNQNFSQNSLSSKLGFKSRAYLSSILNNRRVFPKEKIDQLCKLLKLTHQEQFLLKLLYNHQHFKSENEDVFLSKLAKVRQQITTTFYMNSTTLSQSTIVTEVFFILLRINKKIDLEQLNAYFARYKPNEIISALEVLKHAKLISQVDSTFKINDDFDCKIDLTPKSNAVAKSSFHAASIASKRWFQNSKESIFGVTLLGCTEHELKTSYLNVSQICEEFITNIEDVDSADTLFRLNIAIYPIGRKQGNLLTQDIQEDLIDET